MIVTDRTKFEPIRAGLAIAQKLQSLYPDAWEAEPYGRLLANRATLEALLAGAEMADIESAFAAGLQAFRKRRAAFLLYE